MKKTLLIISILLFANSCYKTELSPIQIPVANTSTNNLSEGITTWTDVFNPSNVLELHFRITRENWNIIRFDATNSIEVPAYFKSTNDENELLVSVRRKSSRALPSESDPWKIGMKIGISKLVSGQNWNGLTKLSLENGSDVGPISEGVAWNLYQLAAKSGFYQQGVEPAQAAWVKVYIDIEDPLVEGGIESVFLGVYINVEQRDKQFLINRGWYVNGSTWLYEVDDIMTDVLEVGNTHSPTYNDLNFLPFRLVTIKQGKKTVSVPTPPDNQLKPLLDSKIDMNIMLTQGAIDAFSSNNDALFSNGKNFKFIDFGNGSKRLYMPWDLDAVFGKNDYNIYATQDGKKITQNNYQKIILNHPYYRLDYNSIMLNLLDGPLSNSNIAYHFDLWKEVVEPELIMDPYESVLNHKKFDELKQWLSNRQNEVRVQIQKNIPSPRPSY